MLVIAITVVTSFGAFVACTGDREPKPTTRTAEPTDVIDQDLMISLLKAKNFHHKARVYMSDGKLGEAIAAVREILSLKFPAGAPEAEDVRNDARALLAKLLIAQGQIEEAMTVVTEGLAQSQRESFFVANLYSVKGEVHQARADALDANDPANASRIKDEKRAAIEAYDKSSQISTVIQQRLMEER
jgi:tetratricopeptide (TPR) repeat protein